MPSRRGAFIALDGTDGSGKATQFKLLMEQLWERGIPFETASFPQYGTKSAGPTEEYLSGKYGSASEVGPHACSILYAVDRFDASFRIRSWLESGIVVLADRYVGSNMGHQGGKIRDEEERQHFFDWVCELEFGTFRIPRPDLNVVLHIPAKMAYELIQQRTLGGGSKHTLARDIHEEDLSHLKTSEEAYLHLARHDAIYRLVEGTEDGRLLSPAEVHKRVWSVVSPLILPS
ncbi:thymidylate kinase [Candidatus Uhrbacteria bacterium]|nr:thymidylate kinase [Candidatus Uhrbacteria bacterium]